MNAISRPTVSRLPDNLEYVDAPYVIGRLEKAGQTLIALPGTGTRPAAYRVMWPEFWTAVEDMAAAEKTRYPVPSAAAITAMDEAFRWIELIPLASIRTRQLILLRLLVQPISDKHVWSWRKLEGRFGMGKDALILRHGRGIGRIVTLLNMPDFIPLPGESLP